MAAAAPMASHKFVRCSCELRCAIARATAPPKHLTEVMKPVMHAMRGLLALISPLPQDMGSSMDDISYMLPQNSRAARMTKELTSCKIIMCKVKGGTLWAARTEMFQRCAGAEAKYGGSLLDTRAMAEQCTAQAQLTSVLTSVLDQWPHWQTLRSGATRELQESVVGAVKRFVAPR